MSTDQVSAALAGVLDALTLVQEQLHALTESSQRIEATHREIVHRLDTIDAGQAAVTDLTPILEMILLCVLAMAGGVHGWSSGGRVDIECG